MTMQVESSRETGNWAYVIRDDKNRRVLATGNRDFALAELQRLNSD